MKRLINFLAILISIHLNAQCFEEVSVGYEHTLVIKTDGTLWSWGSNQSGELGINSGIQKASTPQLINSNNDWKSIFAGSRTSFAIKNDGTLWAWGSGTGGRLGFGNQSSVYLPTQLGTDTDWKLVDSGAHTIAQKIDGTLWGWGSNIYGQLNLNTNSIELVPVQISTETDWEQIVCGGNHTLALKTDGTLWACGLNDFGQLGDGTTTDRLNFVQIGNDNDWVQIDAGEKHSMALKSDGTILGWGQNHIPFTTFYIFGDNYPSQILIPTLLSTDTNWNEISCSGFLLGRKTDGTVWIFEDNTTQIISNDNDWNNTYTGNSHIFLQKLDGTLWGFGDNSKGQLGLGNAIQGVTVPTQLDCSTLGLDDLSNQKILQVYPNPTNNILFIKNSNSIPINEVSITDLTGKVIFKTKNMSEIDFSVFQNGIYIVSINSSNKISKLKVIKK